MHPPFFFVLVVRDPELQYLISLNQPLVIYLRETLVPHNQTSLSNYPIIGHVYIYGEQAFGGAAILVHNSIIAQSIHDPFPVQAIIVS